MADLRREAVGLLQRQAQDHASDTQRIHQEATTNADNKANYAYSTRIQQLELALELKENERVQLLAKKDAERAKLLTRSWGAQRSPTHSSPGSVTYQDLSSEDSSTSQLGILASLGANVFKHFANVSTH